MTLLFNASLTQLVTLYFDNPIVKLTYQRGISERRISMLMSAMKHLVNHILYTNLLPRPADTKAFCFFCIVKVTKISKERKVIHRIEI